MNELVSKNESLMKEWDFEKNDALGLDPQKLSVGSNKKAWWKCEKGHSWQAAIEKRSRCNCPYCSNRRVLPGYNDFASRYPELLSEWGYDKNTDIKPDEVPYASSKKAHWKCGKCSYEWISEIRNRTVYKHDCPQCARIEGGQRRTQTIISRNGSLADTPLLAEWNYSKNGTADPHDYSPHSNKAVWWQCSKCGYEWFANINNRTNGRGCPCCSHSVLVPGKNDLATLNPDLAAQWHPTLNGNLKPSGITPHSGKKVWWLCPKGHSYEATVLHRAEGTNCPMCNSGRQTSFAEQAIYYYVKQIFPDAINRCTDIIGHRMELDIYIPSTKFAIEYDGSYWHKEEKFNRERLKYSLCHKKGIRLLRIKEKIPDFSYGQDTADRLLSTESLDKPENLEQLIHMLMDEIDPQSNFWTRTNPAYIHSQIDINLQRDRFKILEYRPDQKDKSLSVLRPEIADEWDSELNGNLSPDMFTLGSSHKA